MPRSELPSARVVRLSLLGVGGAARDLDDLMIDEHDIMSDSKEAFERDKRLLVTPAIPGVPSLVTKSGISSRRKWIPKSEGSDTRSVDYFILERGGSYLCLVEGCEQPPEHWYEMDNSESDPTTNDRIPLCQSHFTAIGSGTPLNLISNIESSADYQNEIMNSCPGQSGLWAPCGEIVILGHTYHPACEAYINKTPPETSPTTCKSCKTRPPVTVFETCMKCHQDFIRPDKPSGVTRCVSCFKEHAFGSDLGNRCNTCYRESALYKWDKEWLDLVYTGEHGSRQARWRLNTMNDGRASSTASGSGLT